MANIPLSVNTHRGPPTPSTASSSPATSVQPSPWCFLQPRLAFSFSVSPFLLYHCTHQPPSHSWLPGFRCSGFKVTQLLPVCLFSPSLPSIHSLALHSPAAVSLPDWPPCSNAQLPITWDKVYRVLRKLAGDPHLRDLGRIWPLRSRETGLASPAIGISNWAVGLRSPIQHWVVRAGPLGGPHSFLVPTDWRRRFSKAFPDGHTTTASSCKSTSSGGQGSLPPQTLHVYSQAWCSAPFSQADPMSGQRNCWLRLSSEAAACPVLFFSHLLELSISGDLEAFFWYKCCLQQLSPTHYALFHFPRSGGSS